MGDDSVDSNEGIPKAEKPLVFHRNHFPGIFVRVPNLDRHSYIIQRISQTCILCGYESPIQRTSENIILHCGCMSSIRWNPFRVLMLFSVGRHKVPLVPFSTRPCWKWLSVFHNLSQVRVTWDELDNFGSSWINMKEKLKNITQTVPMSQRCNSGKTTLQVLLWSLWALLFLLLCVEVVQMIRTNLLVEFRPGNSCPTWRRLVGGLHCNEWILETPRILDP